MNEKKAKAIRRKVLGDFSIRETTYEKMPTGAIMCTGNKLVYKKSKKLYYIAKRSGLKPFV